MESAPALVVIANAWDGDASGFVARRTRAGAALLTPRDLSRPGWHFRLDDPAATVAVAGGQRFRLHDAGGVLMRLAAVTEVDLPHIHAEDRAFVAAELTAFLLAVLTQADVPVVNRPTPQCLCGPGWHDAKWRHAAARLGLPVLPARWRAARDACCDNEEEAAVAAVTVVGEACLGTASAQLVLAARTLAKMACAEMLTVEYAGSPASPAFVRARPHVDLNDPLVEAAVLRRFGIADGAPGEALAATHDPALGP
jgi:hypothetical protein